MFSDLSQTWKTVLKVTNNLVYLRDICVVWKHRHLSTKLLKTWEMYFSLLLLPNSIALWKSWVGAEDISVNILGSTMFTEIVCVFIRISRHKPDLGAFIIYY